MHSSQSPDLRLQAHHHGTDKHNYCSTSCPPCRPDRTFRYILVPREYYSEHHVHFRLRQNNNHQHLRYIPSPDSDHNLPEDSDLPEPIPSLFHPDQAKRSSRNPQTGLHSSLLRWSAHRFHKESGHIPELHIFRAPIRYYVPELQPDTDPHLHRTSHP